MTRSTAFHGDPALKAELLDSIDRHLAAGTLTFAATAWDGVSGSALGVSTAGTDPAVYADLYGYPLPLAALLDPLAAFPAPTFDAAAFVRNWVDVVTPGADLIRVPGRLMLWMLADPLLAGVNDALGAMLVDLHRAECEGASPARADWAAARRAILAAEPAPDDERGALAHRMWEACAWPAGRGASTLIEAFLIWRQLQARIDDPSWRSGDEREVQAILASLWDENETTRDAGGDVDYPSLLAARDADLADRYASHLRRCNAAFIGAAGLLAAQCITLLRDA